MSNQMVTEIEVHFVVSGDFEPRISEALRRLGAVQQSVRPDAEGYGTEQGRYWKLPVDDTSLSYAQQVSKLLDTLETEQDAVRSIGTMRKAFVDAWVHIYGSQSPGFILDRPTIRRLAALNLGVSLDPLCLPGDDEPEWLDVQFPDGTTQSGS